MDTTAAANMGRRSAEQFIATGIRRKCPFPYDSDSPLIQQLVTAYSVAFWAAMPQPAAPKS